MKLKYKTFLFITPFIIIPILAIGAVAYNKLKTAADSHFNSQITTIMDQISVYMSKELSVSEANLHLLAEHEMVKQYALTEDETVKYDLLLPSLMSVFKKVQVSLPDFYEIRFILPDGFEDARWSNLDNRNISEDISHEKYFQELRSHDNEVFKSIILDENTNEYALLLVHSLNFIDPAVDDYGEKPKLRGYLAFTASLDYLKSEIKKNTIGSDGYLSVVDDSGNILFAPDRNIQPIPAEALRNIKELKDTSSTLLNYKSILIDGVISRVYYSGLGNGINILGVISEKEIIKNSQKLNMIIIFITLIAMVVTVASVYAALQKLVLSPLSILNTATRQIGSGQLDLDINIDSNDEIGSLAKSFINMSHSLRKTHEEVSYTANHDSLTGLPNRGMFKNHLTKILTIEKQKDHKVALLFLDLDDFKSINDTLGHQAGDELLQEVAIRLSSTLRRKNTRSDEVITPEKACDMVARLGGDEFIVLLNDVEGPFDATSVADRIIKKLEDPVQILNRQVYINCSIGITLYPDDAGNANDLIKHADIAMYHAKEHGKNHYQFYSDKLNTDMHDRLKLISLLKLALEKEHFYLVYQPKTNIKTGTLSGLEALIRWQDPELGLVPPSDFIPLAEETGLITQITEWVLETVCNQISEWSKLGVDIVPIAVNISSIQFKRRDLLTMITTALQRAGVSPRYLQVELTETSLLEDKVDAEKIINSLNELGLSVALDDFGTGYSSLSYLNKLSIHTLKIDQSFINDITDSKNDYPIIDAIIALSHAMDLVVVAEGVETVGQLNYLKRKNCDQVQGYYICKPKEANEILNFISNHSS